MKVRDLILHLEDCDPEMNVVLRVQTESGFYDDPGKFERVPLDEVNVRPSTHEVILHG